MFQQNGEKYLGEVDNGGKAARAGKDNDSWKSDPRVQRLLEEGSNEGTRGLRSARDTRKAR